MTAAVVLALAGAVFAVLLGRVAVRRRRWLEVGISAGCAAVLLVLAYAVTRPDVPVWVMLLAGWAVAVLVALAGWSLLREREKRLTGEVTR